MKTLAGNVYALQVDYTSLPSKEQTPHEPYELMKAPGSD